MHFGTSRVARSRAPFVLCALILFAGLLHANSYLSVTPASVSLTCNPVSGLGPAASVTVAYNGSGTALSSTNLLLVGVASVAVTLDGTTTTTYSASSSTLANSPVQVTAPTSQTLNSNAGALTYTVSLKPSVWSSSGGCSGLSATHSTTTAVVTFSAKLGSAAASNDTAQVNATVTQTAPITVSPSPVVVYCEYNGSTRTPVTYPTNVAIYGRGSYSVAIGNPTTAAPWLSLGAKSGSTASASTPVTVAANAASGACPALNPGQSSSGSVTIPMAAASPYADLVVPASVQIVYPTPLNSSPKTVSMTYRKGGSPATGSISVTSAGHSSYFAVDTSTLPSPTYFTVDSFSGTAPTTGGRSLTFSSTSLADNLTPGTYSKDVHLKVTGSADYIVTVNLTVNNPPPVLSIAENRTRSFTWIIGTPMPTPVVTLVSSGTPIAYTIPATTGVVAGVGAGQSSGLAYSMGTQVSVFFDAAQFQAAQPGQTLTGTMTVTGGGATYLITFNVLVNPAATVPTLTGISPSSLPTAVNGQTFTVTLYGTGFNASPDPTMKTIVGIVTNASSLAMTADSYVAVNVVNSSTIILTITANTLDTVLGLTSATTGTKTLGVCNPSGASTCAVAQSTAVLTIGSVPTISAITSASSFQQNAFAPYDIISIFGANFCNSNGTGCGTGVMYGTPDSTTQVYPAALSPDNHARDVVVKFYANPYTATSPVLASAPLLFATNSQINALLPSGLGTTGSVDVVVWFGAAHSSPYTISLADADPGIFTIGSDGQGEAAILASDWSLVNSAHPAIVRPAGSDSVQIYMTGLGAPLAADTASTCIGTTNYLTALQGVSSAITALDGAVMQLGLFPGYTTAPCLDASSTSMSFGGVSAVPSWVGWVTGTVAGLYQVNVALPANSGTLTPVTGVAGTLTAPAQIPVVFGTTPASQSGVTMWVEPRLGWSTAPSTCSGSEAAGATTFTCTPAATGGSGYTYTSTPLPAFLTLTTGAFASTDPVALKGNSYMVTVTAKDGTNPNTLYTTGSFVLDIPNSPAGLALSGTEPTVSVYGVENNAVTTVSATGGTAPVTYSVTTPSDGSITIDPSSGVVATTSTTGAGATHIVIHAVDSDPTTPKTGNLDFYATIALQLSSSNGVALVGSAQVASSSLTRLSTLGSTGAVTFTKIAGPSWVSVGSSTGIIALSGVSGQTAGTYSVTIKASDAGTGATGTINLSVRIN